MLKCSYCPKEFKFESERKRHEQSHVPQFECKKCLKKFSFLSALKRHQKQHERMGTAQCNDCGRHFRDEILLKRHIKYAHKGTYICSKCNTKFNSDIALKSHMKMHKPKSERRFKCSKEGCDKSFNFPHHLKHHELTHTNSKQHYCNICGKGFIQSHHLKSHLRTHDPNHLLPCTINDCKKKFFTENSRRRHVATHSHDSDNKLESSIASNSIYVTADSIKVLLICETCKEVIDIAIYKEHTANCVMKEKPEDLSLNIKDDTETNYNIETFSNCKSVLGKCIATEDSSCLCKQIKDANNFYDSILPNLNFEEPIKLKKEKLDQNVINIANIDKMSDIVDSEIVNSNENFDVDSNVGLVYENNSNRNIDIEPIKLQAVKLNLDSFDQSNGCENCDCSTKNNIMDAIECTNDGAIKLKDTFDFDYSLALDNNDIDDSYRCKMLFGKCIVSGSGAIDEQCLCAKMVSNEEMTQEIEDLMPRPCVS